MPRLSVRAIIVIFCFGKYHLLFDMQPTVMTDFCSVGANDPT